jgi:TetR/AcrR family transcriptional regulator
MTASHHLPADERRALTVQTVLELAARYNPADITTTDIASRMGLTQGALFRHFPSKDALWLAVMEWVAGELMARFARAAEGLASPLEVMRAMFLTHAGFVRDYPGVPRIIFGELQGPAPSPAGKRAAVLVATYGERLRGLIDRAVELGELPEELDREAAVALFIGAIQGLVMQSLLSGDLAHITRRAPGVYALYLRGIRSAS